MGFGQLMILELSLVATVTALHFTGHTLNLLTLMGLMLAVGMVVDNAIVVVESIYARRQQGDGSEWIGAPPFLLILLQILLRPTRCWRAPWRVGLGLWVPGRAGR